MDAIAFVNALPLRNALHLAAPVAPRLASLPRAPPLRRARTPSARHESTSDKPPPEISLPDMPDASYLLTTALAIALAMAPDAAHAVPEALVTAFKSKPLSLVHPGVMWTVFGSASYAFYLGWQSRSIRSATPERRKELVKSKVTSRHFSLASQVLATMTFFTFFGMANTYTRTGKLFPGPHLYNGLGLVALLATMTALVPQMQSGKIWAKNTHFALAFPALFLFAWQAKSGMDIVAKLLGWA